VLDRVAIVDVSVEVDSIQIDSVLISKGGKRFQ
jgi:hypothetical protein